MDWSFTLHSQHGQPQPTTIGTRKLLLLQSTSSSRRTQMSPPLSNTPILLDGQYVENSNGPVLLSQIYIFILLLLLIPRVMIPWAINFRLNDNNNIPAIEIIIISMDQGPMGGSNKGPTRVSYECELVDLFHPPPPPLLHFTVMIIIMELGDNGV